MDCMATRTMLLSGCCAVSDSPLVCVWNFSCIDLGFFAPNLSLSMRAYTRRAALNFATSSKNSMVQQKKNDRRGAKSSIASPCARHVSMYAMALAIVNATSCVAVEPASLMWYPDMDTGYHFGTFLAQYPTMSPTMRIDGSGG